MKTGPCPVHLCVPVPEMGREAELGAREIPMNKWVTKFKETQVQIPAPWGPVSISARWGDDTYLLRLSQGSISTWTVSVQCLETVLGPQQMTRFISSGVDHDSVQPGVRPSSASFWSLTRKKFGWRFGEKCGDYIPIYLKGEEALHFKIKRQTKKLKQPNLPKGKGREQGRGAEIEAGPLVIVHVLQT